MAGQIRYRSDFLAALTSLDSGHENLLHHEGLEASQHMNVSPACPAICCTLGHTGVSRPGQEAGQQYNTISFNVVNKHTALFRLNYIQSKTRLEK